MDSNQQQSPKGMETIAPNTVDLFMSGLYWLEHLAKNSSTVPFSKWVHVLKSARLESKNLTQPQLFWLWEAITSEPGIKKRLGSKVISFDDEWKKQKSIECLPTNTVFGIFLKSFDSMGYPAIEISSKKVKPVAEAKILAPLYLSPGSSRRLKCKDVAVLLTLRVDPLGSAVEEAAALKVDPSDVKIENGCLNVSLKSLNHAYTKTSLRLEPHRRGPGGRAYDHVAKLDGDRYIPLEKIRTSYEKNLKGDLFGGGGTLE